MLEPSSDVSVWKVHIYTYTIIYIMYIYIDIYIDNK